ncbi:MAG: hypothetical protein GX804_05695 [Lentisphaerae bacterium]|jgi:hypothetical protein|nr:hypothetical protein [Lentisphaerota bacterium]
MTRLEIHKEIVELELTFPIPPYEGDEEIRAIETYARLVELYKYIFQDGPMPESGWAPSVPSPTGEERKRIMLHWTNVTADEMRSAKDMVEE